MTFFAESRTCRGHVDQDYRTLAHWAASERSKRPGVHEARGDRVGDVDVEGQEVKKVKRMTPLDVRAHYGFLDMTPFLVEDPLRADLTAKDVVRG